MRDVLKLLCVIALDLGGCAAAALVMLLAGHSAQAGELNCKKPPGALTGRGHLEPRELLCEQCHEANSSDCAVRQQKCLDCHSSVSDEIAGAVGRHSAPGFGNQLCTVCHVMHKGSKTPFAQIHNKQTSYPLVGRHAGVACGRCHKPPEIEQGGLKVVTKSAQWKNPSKECVQCHLLDAQALLRQDHLADAGNNCSACHNPIEQNWRGHQIAPQPFAGAHNRIQNCATCHGGRLDLRGMGTTCITCHQRHDIHHNSLGPRCSDCHSQQTWAGARFNHDTVGCTLRGLHRVLPCVDCHKGGNYAGLSPMCISCHRDDAVRAAGSGAFPDIHIAQTACTPCHNTASFRGVGMRRSPPESVCQ